MGFLGSMLAPRPTRRDESTTVTPDMVPRLSATSTGGFAVIDFETTGLSPLRGDRVVEVAVVHVNRVGRVEGSWETLVNPGRDVGRHDIHGVRAADVLAAPSFAEVAPRLLELLRGRVVVAHNLRFDESFLRAELSRAGYAELADLVGLCTMTTARDLLPGSGRSLRDCCAAYGIDLQNAHRASVDALATAALLGCYLDATSDTEHWSRLADSAIDARWPSAAQADVAWVAREAARVDPTGFLERITSRMPDHSGPIEHTQYLALLDRCLIDDRISVHEAAELVACAEDLGVGRETCTRLHARYFDDLASIAWEDGELAVDEISKLVAVGKLLRVGAAAIAQAMQPRDATEHSVDAGYRVELQLQPGDLIVLTGEMERPREDWMARLTSSGFVPWSAVTKKVRLVVAADPDTLSGKAKKARDYGIPIVDEATLRSLVG